MTIFEALAVLGALGLGALGGWLGFALLGLSGVLLGAVPGAVVGWYGLPLLAFGSVLLAVFVRGGPAGVRAFLARD
jgi:hypothetical protein